MSSTYVDSVTLAALSFRRGEHMRMTTLVNIASPRMQAVAEVVAISAALAFSLFVLLPSYEYAVDESFIVTPALEIANSWRAGALPIGLGLIALVAFIRLLDNGETSQGNPREGNYAGASVARHRVPVNVLAVGRGNARSIRSIASNR
jgi:TRAP-type C4-dicarboxylate transport system permease small subunit